MCLVHYVLVCRCSSTTQTFLFVLPRGRWSANVYHITKGALPSHTSVRRNPAATIWRIHVPITCLPSFSGKDVPVWEVQCWASRCVVRRSDAGPNHGWGQQVGGTPYRAARSQIGLIFRRGRTKHVTVGTPTQPGPITRRLPCQKCSSLTKARYGAINCRTLRVQAMRQ